MRAAAGDEEYLSPSVTARLAALHRSLTNDKLTVREVEVLRLIVRGLSNKEIASELVISRRTAGAHVEHIYAKLGVSNRARASLFAVKHGLMSDE